MEHEFSTLLCISENGPLTKLHSYFDLILLWLFKANFLFFAFFSKIFFTPLPFLISLPFLGKMADTSMLFPCFLISDMDTLISVNYLITWISSGTSNKANKSYRNILTRMLEKKKNAFGWPFINPDWKNMI